MCVITCPQKISTRPQYLRDTEEPGRGHFLARLLLHLDFKENAEWVMFRELNGLRQNSCDPESRLRWHTCRSKVSIHNNAGP